MMAGEYEIILIGNRSIGVMVAKYQVRILWLVCLTLSGMKDLLGDRQPAVRSTTDMM